VCVLHDDATTRACASCSEITFYFSGVICRQVALVHQVCGSDDIFDAVYDSTCVSACIYTCLHCMCACGSGNLTLKHPPSIAYFLINACFEMVFTFTPIRIRCLQCSRRRTWSLCLACLMSRGTRTHMRTHTHTYEHKITDTTNYPQIHTTLKQKDTHYSKNKHASSCSI